MALASGTFKLPKPVSGRGKLYLIRPNLIVNVVPWYNGSRSAILLNGIEVPAGHNQMKAPLLFFQFGYGLGF